jgi:hypothetical protein
MPLNDLLILVFLAAQRMKSGEYVVAVLYKRGKVTEDRKFTAPKSCRVMISR